MHSIRSEQKSHLMLVPRQQGAQRQYGYNHLIYNKLQTLPRIISWSSHQRRVGENLAWGRGKNATRCSLNGDSENVARVTTALNAPLPLNRKIKHLSSERYCLSVYAMDACYEIELQKDLIAQNQLNQWLSISENSS